MLYAIVNFHGGLSLHSRKFKGTSAKLAKKFQSDSLPDQNSDSYTFFLRAPSKSTSLVLTEMEKSENVFSFRSYNQNQFPHVKRATQCMQDLCRKYGKCFPERPPYTGGEELCLKNEQPQFSPEMLNELKKRYMALKLKKLMAVEIMKNHVKGNLKEIVKQIDSHAKSDLKDFVIIGGGPKSLSYFKKKSPTSPPNPTPRIPTKTNSQSGFTLKVDVRGYIPSNISVDTDNNRMSIRATKVNGAEKVLGLLAPSTMALDNVKIYPPTKGFLLLKYPCNM